MKIAVLGMGSIGTRHYKNLKQLCPTCETACYDPGALRLGANYGSFNSFMDAHQDADGAIIASPTECHLEQIDYVLSRNIPAYIEKPLTTIDQWTAELRDRWLGYAQGAKVAVGFQYRYGLLATKLESYRSFGDMTFEASDRLIDRYGAHVLEIMGSHAIDLAILALGIPKRIMLNDRGDEFYGSIMHEFGLSHYSMSIDHGSRISMINREDNSIDNETYKVALNDWLTWIKTGVKPERLATLADGVAVMDVMKQAQQIRR